MDIPKLLQVTVKPLGPIARLQALNDNVVQLQEDLGATPRTEMEKNIERLQIENRYMRRQLADISKLASALTEELEHIMKAIERWG